MYEILEKYKQILESYSIAEKLLGKNYKVYNNTINKNNITYLICGIETDTTIPTKDQPYCNFEIHMDPNGEYIISMYLYGLKNIKLNLCEYVKILSSNKNVKIKDYNDFYTISFKRDVNIINELLKLYFI